MWKSSQRAVSSPIIVPMPQTRQVELLPHIEPVIEITPHKPQVDQATVVTGPFSESEISGEGSLFIEGKIEGSINLPGERVLIGISGNMSATMASTIGKGLLTKGEITGQTDLLVEGTVEGIINLPGHRISIGHNGHVTADLLAKEIVVLGRVRGNITASARADIRAESSVTGDIAGAIITVEDGAFFQGNVNIRKLEARERFATP